ncbi:hypothetical protein [Sphaerisporangium aureirubrum]|uniref:Uncharacterized protein n=1 Tax=Sphaerisporangium aureirubrum TaxID=1544736 RepID=A0ABW1NBZ5_9ACTN
MALTEAGPAEAVVTGALEPGWLCGRCAIDSGGRERCPGCGSVLIARHFPRMPRRLRPGAAVAAVLAVVAAAGALATAGRETSRPEAEAAPIVSPALAVASPVAPPAPEPTLDRAREQAEAVDQLLAGSRAARSGLVDAIADVRACRTAGLSVIGSITDARREQLTSAQTLEVDALDGGSAVRSALTKALNASYQADAAFLAWGRRYVNRGCGGPVEQDPDYRRGLRFSGDAETAKARFVIRWNPVAASFGLKERTGRTI